MKICSSLPGNLTVQLVSAGFYFDWQAVQKPCRAKPLPTSSCVPPRRVHRRHVLQALLFVILLFSFKSSQTMPTCPFVPRHWVRRCHRLRKSQPRDFGGALICQQHLAALQVPARGGKMHHIACPITPSEIQRETWGSSVRARLATTSLNPSARCMTAPCRPRAAPAKLCATLTAILAHLPRSPLSTEASSSCYIVQEHRLTHALRRPRAAPAVPSPR